MSRLNLTNKAVTYFCQYFRRSNKKIINNYNLQVHGIYVGTKSIVLNILQKIIYILTKKILLL